MNILSKTNVLLLWGWMGALTLLALLFFVAFVCFVRRSKKDSNVHMTSFVGMIPQDMARDSAIPSRFMAHYTYPNNLLPMFTPGLGSASRIPGDMSAHFSFTPGASRGDEQPSTSSGAYLKPTKMSALPVTEVKDYRMSTPLIVLPNADNQPR